MYKFIRSKRKRRLAYLATLAIIAFIGITSYLLFVLSRIHAFLATEGFSKVKKVESIADRNLIILRGECSELSFFVSPEQALAIERGLKKEKWFRPLTHDLLANILENIGARPLMVKITSLHENTYFAELILQQWNRFFLIDIRPSDGIALALRTDIPIYVKESLMMKTC